MSELSVVITGGLHGIGAEIVERFAQEQCRIAIIANAKGTDMEKIAEKFSQYRKMGSDVRILPTDIMDEAQIHAAVEKAAGTSGGVIDVCINAALISQAMTYEETTPEKLDLFYKINAKSSYMLLRACHSYLKKSHNPHVLNIAPPINLDPKVMGYRMAYTVSQYLRSMLTVSVANNDAWRGIACNALWPVAPFHDGGNLGIYQSHIDGTSNLKSVKLFSEAVYGVVTQPADRYTGEFFYDEEVLEMLSVPIEQFCRHIPQQQNLHQQRKRNQYEKKSVEINYNRHDVAETRYEDAIAD
jgi:citronellol/citronellal dehydrogenase